MNVFLETVRTINISNAISNRDPQLMMAWHTASGAPLVRTTNLQRASSSVYLNIVASNIYSKKIANKRGITKKLPFVLMAQFCIWRWILLVAIRVR
jgi:hypothetical protein